MSLPLVITPGDPAGIGPEVAVAAARRLRVDAVLVGEGSVLPADLPRVEGLETAPPGLSVLQPAPGAEPVEVRALRQAVADCLEGRARALVTGPIHKARLRGRGFAHSGHTGFLGELCDVPEPVMAFVGGRLRVALVTTHLPLAKVPAAVTPARLERVVRCAHDALRDRLALAAPRVVVCGLNPHAGEQGVLGREELEVIGPVCEVLRAEGLAVSGPVGAETAFLRAVRGEADLVVTMYHDQGLAPLKLLDFGRSVNWTLGLPMVRTSVDHGTADDIAGLGVADPASMEAAIRLALELTRRG